MSVQRFDFETPECVAAMNESGVFVERGPDYILVLSGADIPPQPVPESVTPWQMRKALNATGKRAVVDTLLANPQTPRNIIDGWEVASEWRRDDPVLLAMAGQLGMNDAEIDALFRLASTL